MAKVFENFFKEIKLHYVVFLHVLSLDGLGDVIGVRVSNDLTVFGELAEVGTLGC
jgi:hypothetical protein